MLCCCCTRAAELHVASRQACAWLLFGRAADWQHSCGLIQQLGIQMEVCRRSGRCSALQSCAALQAAAQVASSEHCSCFFLVPQADVDTDVAAYARTLWRDGQHRCGAQACTLVPLVVCTYCSMVLCAVRAVRAASALLNCMYRRIYVLHWYRMRRKTAA
jgi:hypothetical protein